MDKHGQAGIYVLLEERVPGALETGPNDAYLTAFRHHVCSLDVTLPVRTEVPSSKPHTKRYNLSLSRSTFEAIEKIAQKHKMTVSRVIRIYIQLTTEPSRVAEAYKSIQTFECIGVFDEIEALVRKQKIVQPY